jgi:hypothetical protein
MMNPPFGPQGSLLETLNKELITSILQQAMNKKRTAILEIGFGNADPNS